MCERERCCTKKIGFSANDNKNMGRRRSRQNKLHRYNDEKANTFIINGGNNQIGDNNTQNNYNGK